MIIKEEDKQSNTIDKYNKSKLHPSQNYCHMYKPLDTEYLNQLHSSMSCPQIDQNIKVKLPERSWKGQIATSQ